MTLVDATDDELRCHNDVCAICYSDMLSSAKVTPCGHYFHGGCLKKWLFVQDHCPMCSSKVIEEETPQEDPRDVQEEDIVVGEEDVAAAVEPNHDPDVLLMQNN
jgi:E3 ubiquitin-protein ligase RNF139